MRYILLILIFNFLANWSVLADIRSTKHNLSVSGTGLYKASEEGRICVFCHTPHKAEPAEPLWNHRATTQTFIPYNQAASGTLLSNPGQPDGSSKLCLGCHDGTVALGAIGATGTVAGLSAGMSGSSLLGTNLTTSHPISFVYDTPLAAASGQLANPATLPSDIKLDSSSKLQCTTCHDPHDNSKGSFLVRNNTGAAFCLTCHQKTGWNTAIHRTSPTMGEQNCNACHQPHNAVSVPLLKDNEVDLCFSCHGAAGPAPTNIEAQFAGTSTYPGVGDPDTYSTVNTHHDVKAADQAFSGAAITCGNCHNPHIAQKSTNNSSPIRLNLIDPFDRTKPWTGGGAVTYQKSIINFCLSCHSGVMPGAVSNPLQPIGPTSPIKNIGAAYLVDRHGDGSIRPTPTGGGTPVARMICTDCHSAHGSSYSGQSWDGNVYGFADTVDGTAYADNGAEWADWGWAYISPLNPIGIVKQVRVSPDYYNTKSNVNNLYNLCQSCHSVTGNSHIHVFGTCTGCHDHGRPANYGGL